MKLERNNQAVAEIVGAMILVAIAVAAFSVIYLNILSDPGPSEETYVTIVGKMETGNVTFDLRRGESLGQDSKILLNIGGDLYNFSANEFLKTNNPSNLLWNIGERFIYPASQFRGDLINRDETVYVDATIVDKKSNSVVFWGILQQGYVKGLFGLGGIWHLNETTGNIAHDSSGNNNHGILMPNFFGPKWNSSSYKAGGCSLTFDGINDYVEVPSSFSLNITNAITVEAWMKPFKERTILTTTKFDQKFGFTPNIIHVSDKDNSDNDELYAVVSELQGNTGLLSIFNITYDGDTEFTGNEWFFDKSSGGAQRNILSVIEYVNDEMYIISYQKNDNKLYVKTVNITANGIIQPLKEASFADSKFNSNPPCIIKISNEICAIVYRAFNNSGILRTINILSDGKINEKNIFYFDTSSYEPKIINVLGDVYAIVYRASNGTGIIRTINITNNGDITDKNNILYFSDFCYEPDIINITKEVYAIVYHNSLNQGTLKTVNISINGRITDTNNILTFEKTSECHTPSIILQYDNVCLISYSTGHAPGSSDKGGNSKGYFLTIEIFSNGSIGKIIQSKTEFENNRCYDPKVIKISNRIFAFVYEGKWLGVPPNDHPGALVTVLTRDPTSPYKRGIFKAGSTTIYAEYPEDEDKITIYACVNGPNHNLTLQVPPNSDWYHIALTYDRINIILYCTFYDSNNNIIKLNISTGYTGLIQINQYPLWFGHLFYGNLDEIAIFDRALNPIEIENHFKYPGFFENEPSPPPVISNIALSVSYNSARITWITDKPSNSKVKYDTTTPPTSILSDSSIVMYHSVTLTNLLAGTTYYFEVQSTDQNGNIAIDNNGGSFYTFTTDNRAPYVPSNPNPADNQKDVSTIGALSWIGGDPDTGDTVTYDVYFGTNINPPLIISNHPSTTYNPGTMSYNTKYYWKIVARDNHGKTIIGPKWSFNTIKKP